MTKYEIISIMEDFANDPDVNFKDCVGKDDSRIKIGTNQFRNIASMCTKCQCIEEIILLIQYNHAKSAQSWTKAITDTLVKKINEIDSKDKEHALENTSLFFGYLYWKARILTAL